MQRIDSAETHVKPAPPAEHPLIKACKGTNTREVERYLLLWLNSQLEADALLDEPEDEVLRMGGLFLDLTSRLGWYDRTKAQRILDQLPFRPDPGKVDLFDQWQAPRRIDPGRLRQRLVEHHHGDEPLSGI